MGVQVKGTVAGLREGAERLMSCRSLQLKCRGAVRAGGLRGCGYTQDVCALAGTSSRILRPSPGCTVRVLAGGARHLTLSKPA